MPGEGAIGANMCFMLAGNVALKFVYGQHTTVDENDTKVTGLSRVLGAMATLESDPVAGCTQVQAVVGNQSSAPAAGSILIKSFKPTAAGNTAPTAASTFSMVVNWCAWGYP